MGRHRSFVGPLVRVLAGGVALLALARLVAPAETPDGDPEAAIVIGAEEVARLRSTYVAESGLAPTPDDEVALVERAIDEELLFREALARSLDDDPSVRSWLVQQMRALGDDATASEDELHARARALGLDRRDVVVRRILVGKMRLLAARAGEEEAQETEVGALYERRRDAYRLPELLDVRHVLVAARGGDDAAHARAARLLAELRREQGDAGVAAPARAGDPFAVASPLAGQSRAQLAKLFGAAFADAVSRAPEGLWTGPIASPFGLHLVRVERRAPGAAPPLAEVRGRVVEEWRQERRGERLARLLRELRARHVVEVESPAWRERRGT